MVGRSTRRIAVVLGVCTCGSLTACVPFPVVFPGTGDYSEFDELEFTRSVYCGAEYWRR
jgi:hypothetical protein